MHCQFCVNLVSRPHSTCVHTMSDESQGVGDCPCTMHDAWVDWPLGPDGYRRPYNTAGIDMWELDIDNYEDDGSLSQGEGWLIAHGPLNKEAGFTWPRGEPSEEFCTEFMIDADIFRVVKATGRPNYQEARVPLNHGLNIDVWRHELSLYNDQRLLDYLQYGFPLGYIAMHPPSQNHHNHASALNYAQHVDSYIAKELSHGSLIGPLNDIPTARLLT